MLRRPARLRHVALLASAGLCAALGLTGVPAVANDEAEVPDEPKAAREGILVMRRTGAIVSGKILKSGSVYVVQCPAGRMSVPEDLVKLRCDNLPEAYEKLHTSAVAQNTADAHLILARWCMGNHLEREARRELQAALALEPDREETKKLLRNVEERPSGPATPEKRSSPGDPVRAARIAAVATGEGTVSLGGLSRENAAQFARRIQPLLVANCTAAGCHGRDSQTKFRLTRVTPGKDANRHAAEHNLVEVLAQIDVSKPRSSPLLSVPRANHGRHGKPIFSGQRGEEQLADLRNWVVAISREQVVREKRDKTARKGGPIELTSAADADEPDDAPAPRKKASSLPGTKRFGGTAKGDFVQRPLPPSRDPFDPGAFNSGAGARSRR